MKHQAFSSKKKKKKKNETQAGLIDTGKKEA
jgi:hypothetical protein